VGEDSESSRQDGVLSKLDCFIRLDEMNLGLSRTLGLKATVEINRYQAFRGSFRELRRESRKAEFALVAPLYQFQHEMEKRASDANNR
jgi:hypothetical protein